MQNWYDLDFEEYIRQGEPDKKQRTYDWQTAIGLQAVDGLTPSDYLIQTAKKNIEGDITIQEVKSLINTYYESRTERNESNDDRTEEADKVSVRIAEILGELAFNFSIIELKNIHKRLFTGIFSHAGEFRDYNITKKEWVLKGDTVIYTTADILQETLTYDFEQEKKFSYDGLSADDFIKHICSFVSGIWQIHPFGEGNTRTTSVFTIKYLRTLGFNVTNDAFSKNSWYFRNALVRANYTNVSKGIKPAPEFLEAFFRNLLLGEENELKNRYMHLDAPSLSAKLALTDDSKGSIWHFGESQQANSAVWESSNRTNLPIGKLHKCTLEELAVFNAIKENQKLTQKEISERIGKAERTVRRICANLIEKEIITRENGKRYGEWKILCD